MLADPKMPLASNNSPSFSTQVDAREVLEQIKKLRRFQGSRSLFWGAFARQTALLCKACFACVLQQNQEQEWLCLAQDASEAFSQDQLDAIWQSALALSGRAFKQGFAYEPLSKPLPAHQYPVTLCVALEMPRDETPGLLVLLLDKEQEQSFKEALVRSQLISDIPASLDSEQVNQASEVVGEAHLSASQKTSSTSHTIVQGEDSASLLASALDVNSIMQKQDAFGLACMTLVNEIASRFECLRVSLGWHKHDYVEAVAISHLDRIEKKTDACQSLQNVFDECFDQDEELNWPGSLAGGAVLIAHERYSRTQSVAHLFSLPLRVDDHVVGVLLCERNDVEFTLDDCRAIRLCIDQVQAHLQRLYMRDQWVGLRIKTWMKKKFTSFLGPEHTLLKFSGIVGALLLLFVIAGTWPYKVELTATLETDQVVFISAPFDGHVSEVNVHTGDWVEPNTPLLQLDTQELLLKESEAHSDVLRYARESEKARASGAYADMRVAEARQTQAQALLERMQYYLKQSAPVAPFKGVVVEGDKERLLGAPVSKGDTVFKIAQIEGLYAKLQISEQDVREIRVGDKGQLALLSRPKERFAIEIVDIIPVAEVKPQEGNVFIVKAKFDKSPLEWWRPGMSGLAKIDVGKRRILWILTHRLNDFLRMRFWW